MVRRFPLGAMKSSRVMVAIINIANLLPTDEFKLFYMYFITIRKPEIFHPSATVPQKQGVILLNSNSSRRHGTKQRKQERLPVLEDVT